MNATVKDVMTTHVIAVREYASYKEMAARLRKHRVSAFPVLDEDNKVIGIVSEADLLAKEAADGGHAGMPRLISGVLRHREQKKAAAVTAGDLMSHPAVTAGPDDPVEHAARLMYDRRVKRLPVTDPAGHLIGIISRADVLAVYSRPDEEIRKEINEVILHEFLLNLDRFHVTVQDGIVTVAGTSENPLLSRDIIAQVRHVQGVVAVRDRLG